MNLRLTLRSLWVGLLASSGCLWWVKRKLRKQGAVVALVFHRVLSDSDYLQTYSQPEILVRERTFRALAEYVEREYEALDLHEAVPGKSSEKLRVVFTFDDGWGDNYSVALPLARTHGIPLTVFLCPRLVAKNMPFWPERVVALRRAAKPDTSSSEIKILIESIKKQGQQEREQTLARLAEEAHQQGVSVGAVTIDRTLSWQEIVQMDRAGVRFGSHTHSHEILTAIPAEMARREVDGSDAAIEEMLGKPCKAFSYPNGNWSAESRAIVAEAGFKLAVTGDRRPWSADSDPLAIPRSNVYEDDLVGLDGRFSPAMFEYTAIWKAWRRSTMKSSVQARTQAQPTSATF